MAAELQNDGSTVTIDLVAEFRRLAAKWHQEAGYLSSLTEAFERPAYREIIALGPDVVPIILRELESGMVVRSPTRTDRRESGPSGTSWKTRFDIQGLDRMGIWKRVSCEMTLEIAFQDNHRTRTPCPRR